MIHISNITSSPHRTLTCNHLEHLIAKYIFAYLLQLACIQQPPSPKINWERDICVAPSLIMFQNMSSMIIRVFIYFLMEGGSYAQANYKLQVNLHD